MLKESVLRVPDLPLHIGPTPTPSNPSGIPNTLAFELRFDRQRGVLVQVASPKLEELLALAYRVGLEIGTPLADDVPGRAYVEDFLDFIRANASTPPGHALEIGAGVGYLSRRLIDEGWTVDSLEPGVGYERHWQNYGVAVINDFFPSVQAQGPYDLICSYAVLEHIPDPEKFLTAIRDHLKPGGVFVMSVPDCGKEIENGDPAMLIHEHYNYFDRAGLEAMLDRAGFAANTRVSGYGRAIYASAKASARVEKLRDESVDIRALETFPARCQNFVKSARAAFASLADRGSLGVYCPTRALAVLPQDIACRFFDDSSALHGKYIPPFVPRIESRSALVEHPTDFLVIMSHTFGQQLKRELDQLLPHTTILTANELIRVDQSQYGSDNGIQ